MQAALAALSFRTLLLHLNKRLLSKYDALTVRESSCREAFGGVGD